LVKGKKPLQLFKITVWEENVGALTLARMEPGRTTPQSKLYAVKYHWFHSHLKPNSVEIEKDRIGKAKRRCNVKRLAF